ncbi:MAG: tail-specific protease [Proteobacteria bacterium]|nr:MAG: tail-specific protease [Pseudomonadota bacterium]
MPRRLSWSVMSVWRTSLPSRRPVSRFLVVPALAALLLAAPVPAPVQASPAEDDASSALTCEALPRLLGAYLQNHVQYRALTEDLKQRVAESNLRHLDPSRSLFVESDAEAVRKQFGGVFTGISRGDCSLLEAMHKNTIQRYEEMEDFVRKFVSRDDYAIDQEASLVIDPEKRGFPTNKAEREDLYRRLVHFQMSNYVANDEPLDEAKGKLIHRYELMTKRAKEMKRDEIYARFLDAFSSALDPHSAYLSPDNLEDFKIHMGLSLEGIGAVLSSRDGYTIVEEIVPGGSAAKEGNLKPKDRILAVAQEDGDMVDVIDMDLRDVVRMIRGKKGSVVRLSVLRQGAETERFSVRLVRDKINLEEQAAKLRFEEIEANGKKYKLAVLDLPSFYGDKEAGSRQATEDVAKLLKQARAEKADGLLLDLSRNGGGLLDYAVKITGFFIGTGGVVAVGDGRQQTQVLDDPDEQIQWSGPLVVLTSRVTASAAEIFAGAVKDYRRGVIVGDDHTFGKGSVQTVAPLPPGLGALKLTTALFYRPGGQSTQQIGVPADIVLPALTANDQLGESNQPYSLAPRSIPPFANGKPKVAGGYVPVDAATVQRLMARSKERVAGDARFADIQQELAKQKENEGAVKVADLLEKKEKEDAEKKGDGSADAAGSPSGDSAMINPTPGIPGDEGQPDDREPQVQEALRILADLVGTRSGVAMNP